MSQDSSFVSSTARVTGISDTCPDPRLPFPAGWILLIYAHELHQDVDDVW